MSGEAPGGTVLTVAGDLHTVRGLVAQFFTDRGWQVHERGPGELSVETGSLRRTVFLGAFAGRRFHLRSQIELREVRGGAQGAVEVHYLWGAGAGRALGGSVGRARASRRHLETALALEQQLRAGGRSVQARPR